MKCPKCGFTSFDYLQECKKCGNELSEFKSRFNLKSVIFPAAAAPATLPVGGDIHEEPVAPSEPTNFGIDFMEEASAAETSEVVVPQDSAESFDLGEEESAEGGQESKTWFLDPEASQVDSLDFSDQEDAPAESEAQEEGGGEDRSEDAFLKLDFESSWEEDLPGEEALEETLETPQALDLPSFEELPSLEESEEEDSEIADLEQTDLSTWDFDEPEEDARRSSGGEEPSDPFDDRESAPVERIPETHGSDVDPLLESAFEPALEEEELAGMARDTGGIDPEEGREADAAQPASVEQEERLVLPRLAATCLDLVLLGGVFSLFVAAGELAMNPGPNRIWPTAQVLFELVIPYFLVLFGLFFGYFTLFHYLTGQTVGKMILGLRVEGHHGEPLHFSQAFLRSAGGLLSLLCAGAGFMWIALDGQGRGWNDRLAGTRVTRKEGPDPCEGDLAGHLA